MGDLDFAQAWPWLVIVGFLAFWLGRFTAGGEPRQSPEERRAATEANIQRLSAQARGQAEAMLRDNRLIEAVKVIRADTNLGLRDSKDVADELNRRRRGTG